MRAPTKIVSSEFCLYGDGAGHPESLAHAIYICDRFSEAGAGALVDAMTDICPDINAANLTTFHEDSDDADTVTALSRLTDTGSYFDTIFVNSLDQFADHYRDVLVFIEHFAQNGVQIRVVPTAEADRGAAEHDQAVIDAIFAYTQTPAAIRPLPGLRHPLQRLA